MHALGAASPLVRAHVAWALGEIVARERQRLPPVGATALRTLLQAALAREQDYEVRAELDLAASALDASAG